MNSGLCSCRRYTILLERRLPKNVVGVGLYEKLVRAHGCTKACKLELGEWECPVTGRKADVALLDESQSAVLLVEVWHTHAVDHAKRQDLAPYWWIEVEASEVLTDPTKLRVCNHGNLPDALALVWEQLPLLLA